MNACKKDCSFIGWDINKVTQAIRPIVASSDERKRGDWHTACDGCADRFIDQAEDRDRSRRIAKARKQWGPPTNERIEHLKKLCDLADFFHA